MPFIKTATPKTWEALFEEFMITYRYDAECIRRDNIDYARKHGNLFACETVEPEHREAFTYALWDFQAPF